MFTTMKPIVLVLYFITASIGQGIADELYDFDCFPDDDRQVIDTGAVILLAAGYYGTELDELVRFDDPRVRMSRDGQYHVCTRTSATPDLSPTEINQIRGTRVVKCLYVPSMSW